MILLTDFGYEPSGTLGKDGKENGKLIFTKQSDLIRKAKQSKSEREICTRKLSLSLHRREDQDALTTRGPTEKISLAKGGWTITKVTKHEQSVMYEIIGCNKVQNSRATFRLKVYTKLKVGTQRFQPCPKVKKKSLSPFKSLRTETGSCILNHLPRP